MAAHSCTCVHACVGILALPQVSRLCISTDIPCASSISSLLTSYPISYDLCNFPFLPLLISHTIFLLCLTLVQLSYIAYARVFNTCNTRSIYLPTSINTDGQCHHPYRKIHTPLHIALSAVLPVKESLYRVNSYKHFCLNPIS
jgi:hypothetical protein